jgi:dipeptide/tripeptide permease
MKNNYTDAEPDKEFESNSPGKADSLDEQDGQFDPSEPSARDMETLRRVPDNLPPSAFLVAIVELCERFTFYGLSGPFQNYISNKYKGDANPGALGLGQASATALTSFFSFWCYVTPIIGAIVADQYLGKYKAIVYFSITYFIGLLILFATSLPISIENGAAYGGLVTAMVVIGVGAGGIKSNVSPLIADQITETRHRVQIEKSGERVLVDPALTVQRVYMVFYFCINIGGLSAIATTNMELYTGFWSAYLLCLCTFAVGIAILITGKKTYVVKPPKGSIITDSFRALWMVAKSKNGFEGLKPSTRERLGQSSVPWDDTFVNELQRALVACKMFLFLPVYWLAFGQVSLCCIAAEKKLTRFR